MKARTYKYDHFCDHWKIIVHTKDTCFKILGEHEWFLNLKNKNSQKMASIVHDLPVTISSDTPLEDVSIGKETSSSILLIKIWFNMCLKVLWRWCNSNEISIHPLLVLLVWCLLLMMVSFINFVFLFLDYRHLS